MSIGAEIWRQIVSRVEVVPQCEVQEPQAARFVHSVPEPASALVHQLFFPSPQVRRTAVLLAAADAHSKASQICEQVAIALSNSSGEMVGIVESNSSEEPLLLKKRPTNVDRSIWQTCAISVAERVRRIPSALVCKDHSKKHDVNGGGLSELRGTFPYFLLSAAIADSEMPWLCNMCDAAVLVVTANVTRKRTALRAKEQVLRHGVTLLGTVLDQRTLPIPESVYRWL